MNDIYHQSDEMSSQIETYEAKIHNTGKSLPIRKFKILWRLRTRDSAGFETVYALDELSAKNAFWYTHNPNLYKVVECQELPVDQDKK